MRASSCAADGIGLERISFSAKATAAASWMDRIRAETPRSPTQYLMVLALKLSQKHWACTSPSSISRSASYAVLLTVQARWDFEGMWSATVTRGKAPNGVVVESSVFHLDAAVSVWQCNTSTRRSQFLAPALAPDNHSGRPLRRITGGIRPGATHWQAGW